MCDRAPAIRIVVHDSPLGPRRPAESAPPTTSSEGLGSWSDLCEFSRPRATGC